MTFMTSFFKHLPIKLITVVLLVALPLISGCNNNTTEITQTGEADRGKRLVADNGMVSSAHPLASEALAAAEVC